MNDIAVTVELASPVSVALALAPAVNVDLGFAAPVSVAVELATPVEVAVAFAAPVEIEIELAGAPGATGAQGQTGQQGAQGIPGSGATFTLNFAAIGSGLTVVHNLGKYPSVTVIDSANDEVDVDVLYIDTNTIRISASANFGGVVICN